RLLHLIRFRRQVEVGLRQASHGVGPESHLDPAPGQVDVRVVARRPGGVAAAAAVSRSRLTKPRASRKSWKRYSFSRWCSFGIVQPYSSRPKNFFSSSPFKADPPSWPPPLLSTSSLTLISPF